MLAPNSPQPPRSAHTHLHPPAVSQPRLSVRCNPQLLTRVQNRAAREGVCLSVALRALLSDYAAGRAPTVAVARSIDALKNELRPIGVNLNQAAHALNSGRYPRHLEPNLRRLVGALRRLRTLLDSYALPHKP